MVKKILLDTNFILDCIKFHLDIKSEISKVLDENFSLNIFDVTKKELREKKYENIALELINRFNVNILNTDSSNVDQAIFALDKKDLIVATSDKKLKEKLKNSNIPILLIRQKRHLKLI